MRVGGPPARTRFVVYADQLGQEPMVTVRTYARRRGTAHDDRRDVAALGRSDLFLRPSQHQPQIVLSDTVSGYFGPIDQQHRNVLSVAPLEGEIGRDVDLDERDRSPLAKPVDDRLHVVTEMAAVTGVQREFHTGVWSASS